MYNISKLDEAVEGNDLGIFELDPQRYSQEDLDEFYAKYASEVPKGTGPELASVNGGKAPTDQSHAGGEADLDFQIGIPLIYPQGSVNYQVVGQDRDDLFDSFLDAVDGTYCSKSNQGDCGTFKPVPVISFSWGATEVDWPTNYLKVCTQRQDGFPDNYLRMFPIAPMQRIHEARSPGHYSCIRFRRRWCRSSEWTLSRTGQQRFCS